MMDSTQFGCAATYLNKVEKKSQPQVEKKELRKVEPVSSAHKGTMFNLKTGKDADHGSFDVSV